MAAAEADAHNPNGRPALHRRVLLGGLFDLAGTGALIQRSRRPIGGMMQAGIGAAFAPAPPVHTPADDADLAEWGLFRSRFIAPEGRVVDSANGGISHSEGQGLAMLFAEWANDRSMFESLLGWTRSNLRRSGDTLSSWRWKPGQINHVDDSNNASDGDLAIAWALMRASDRWSVPEWHQQATDITRDILSLLVCEAHGRTVLLPGASGFQKRDRLIVNPSYYNLPAIRALASLTTNSKWAKLEADGAWLLEAARFGSWGLPADWIQLGYDTDVLKPAVGWPARFSWDAVRVPLFLAWAGEKSAPTLAASSQFWANGQSGGVPAWVDLSTNAMAPYPGHAGIAAVASLTKAVLTGAAPINFPKICDVSDYYAGALVMMCRMALREQKNVISSPRQLASK